jgi:hypothetical protein
MAQAAQGSLPEVNPFLDASRDVGYMWALERFEPPERSASFLLPRDAGEDGGGGLNDWNDWNVWNGAECLQ